MAHVFVCPAKAWLIDPSTTLAARTAGGNLKQWWGKESGSQSGSPVSGRRHCETMSFVCEQASVTCDRDPSRPWLALGRTRSGLKNSSHSFPHLLHELRALVFGEHLVQGLTGPADLVRTWLHRLHHRLDAVSSGEGVHAALTKANGYERAALHQEAEVARLLRTTGQKCGPKGSESRKHAKINDECERVELTMSAKTWLGELYV